MKFFIPKPDQPVKNDDKPVQSSIESAIKDPHHLTE